MERENIISSAGGSLKVAGTEWAEMGCMYITSVNPDSQTSRVR
ncbi:hypothetical protein [Hafnia alvei]|nr:hypothetical protein [Hafnia alvei]